MMKRSSLCSWALVLAAGCGSGLEGEPGVAEPAADPAAAAVPCAVGSTVGLFARGNGRYVTADLRVSGTPLLSQADHNQQWEQYQLVDAGGGQVALRSKANGLYVSADLNRGGALVAGWATTIQGWEQFRLVPGGDGWYGLRSSANGRYVSADLNQGGALRAAWATNVQDWEKFQCASVGGNGGGGGGTPRDKVLAYITQVSGNHTIAGQHNKHNATPASATDWVRNRTGRQPGLWSGDFLFGGDEVSHRADLIAEAKRQFQSGAIVQLMYHACSPTRDEYCGWDDIGGANPQHLSDAQWNELISDGTALNRAWKGRLDTLAVYLSDLKAAGVAPLFRPLHEMNQGVFWWGGRPGANGTRRLYQITHDYLVKTKGLDNLIWVWDVQDFGSLGSDVQSYNPGASYYDIAALDVYDGGFDQWKYDAMRGAAGSKPLAIGECATLPSSATLAAQPRWAFFMLWPDFLDQNAGAFPGVYSAGNVVTQGQMPGWK